MHFVILLFISIMHDQSEETEPVLCFQHMSHHILLNSEVQTDGALPGRQENQMSIIKSSCCIEILLFNPNIVCNTNHYTWIINIFVPAHEV